MHKTRTQIAIERLMALVEPKLFLGKNVVVLELAKKRGSTPMKEEEAHFSIAAE